MNAKISTVVKSLAPILVLTTVWSLPAADDASSPEEKSPKNVNLGKIARHGDLSIAEGYAVIGEGAPGIGFGLTQKGRQKVQVSYFVIFKNDFTSKGSKTRFSQSAQGQKGLFQATYTTQIDDATLTIKHQIGGGKEILNVCGKDFQAAKGRVFLVDLIASPPTVEQKNISLPAQAAAPERKESDIETIADTVLAELVQKEDAVRQFVAPATP